MIRTQYYRINTTELLDARILTDYQEERINDGLG